MIWLADKSGVLSERSCYMRLQKQAGNWEVDWPWKIKPLQRFLVLGGWLPRVLVYHKTPYRGGVLQCIADAFYVRKQETPLTIYWCIVIQPGRVGHNFCVFLVCSGWCQRMLRASCQVGREREFRTSWSRYGGLSLSVSCGIFGWKEIRDVLKRRNNIGTGI